MTTGQRISRARRNAGLSQLQLGRLAGVRQEAVAHWEKDRRSLYAWRLCVVAAACGVRPVCLIGGQP